MLNEKKNWLHFNIKIAHFRFYLTKNWYCLHACYNFTKKKAIEMTSHSVAQIIIEFIEMIWNVTFYVHPRMNPKCKYKQKKKRIVCKQAGLIKIDWNQASSVKQCIFMVCRWNWQQPTNSIHYYWINFETDLNLLYL